MARFLNVVFSPCLILLALSAHAQQSYPNRPVRLILPLAPGGTTDIMARTVSPHLSAGLGQPVIVENRTGAGGVVGADFVAKAPPDGYTLLLVSADTYTTNAVTYPKLPFDARKDLKPVSILAAGPSVLTVHPSLPVKTVKELVALSKARPKDLNYGSGGTSGQLLVELVKLNTGMIITNIPYKGSGPALIDQVAGHVQVGFFNIVATLPFIQSGRLRPLVVSGNKRSPKLPDVPSTSELNIKGFDEPGGHTIMVPGATPAEIVNRLHRELVKVMQVPEVGARLTGEGAEVVANTPEQAASIVNRSLDKWADVVRRTGIKLE